MSLMALADKPTDPKLDAEMKDVEARAISTIREGFKDNYELNTLLEGYKEHDPADGRIIVFDALWVYVEITLVPKLRFPTPPQKKALEEFKRLVEQHQDLQKRYYDLQNQ